MTDALTDKQRRFVELYAGGLDKVSAARMADYQGSGAKKAGSRLLKNPIVRQAIEAIQAEARTVAVYGLVEAMREAESAATFARANKNSMALVKACELRAKLSGLLIDRIEITPIDLRGALEAAERRVLDITPPPRAELGPEADRPATGGAHWTAPIPGKPLGD